MTFPWEVPPAEARHAAQEPRCADCPARYLNGGCSRCGGTCDDAQPELSRAVTYNDGIPTVLRRDKDNRAPFMDAELVRELAADIEASTEVALFGPAEPQPQTAVRVVNGRFETVQLREDGSAIEQEPRCPFCSPVLLCSKHFICT